MKLSGHGFDVDLLDGWEARLFRRPLSVGSDDTQPIVHLANFPLPEVRGDFGAGVVEYLRSGDIFVVFFDYGPDAVGQRLFARQGMPTLEARHFHAGNLQRTIGGQVGAQRFFEYRGRALGLYIVAASAPTARNNLSEMNRAIGGVTPVGAPLTTTGGLNS